MVTNNTKIAMGESSEFFYLHNRLLLPLYTIGIMGNLLIIVYFMRMHRMNMTAYNFLIVMLALVDLFICITTPITRFVFFEMLFNF